MINGVNIETKAVSRPLGSLEANDILENDETTKNIEQLDHQNVVDILKEAINE